MQGTGDALHIVMYNQLYEEHGPMYNQAWHRSDKKPG